MRENELEYVGFWARVGAWIIDTILLMLITLPILLVYRKYYGTRFALKLALPWSPALPWSLSDLIAGFSDRSTDAAIAVLWAVGGLLLTLTADTEVAGAESEPERDEEQRAHAGGHGRARPPPPAAGAARARRGAPQRDARAIASSRGGSGRASSWVPAASPSVESSGTLAEIVRPLSVTRSPTPMVVVFAGVKATVGARSTSSNEANTAKPRTSTRRGRPRKSISR